MSMGETEQKPPNTYARSYPPYARTQAALKLVYIKEKPELWYGYIIALFKNLSTSKHKKFTDFYEYSVNSTKCTKEISEISSFL